MTVGEVLIRSVAQKTQFRDAHARRAYLRSLEVARRIVDDPSILTAGRAFLDRFVRDDPHQKDAYELWLQMLRLPPQEIARRLVADDDVGERLRETAPVFSVITPQATRSS